MTVPAARPLPVIPTRTADGAGVVLLVEDDSGDAVLVEEYLNDTELPVSLSWVQTFDAARAYLTGRTPDCVLLDLHLPDASGIAAVEEMQSLCPDAAVIVLTGLDETRAGLEAVAAGAQDYLPKARVTPELLDRAIRYALHRKNTERTTARLRENELRAQENARLERGLLPAPLLRSTTVVSSTCYLPGRKNALLGGDFLDIVETPDGLLHAVIGDVSGHGPDAAALGVCLRITWRSLVLGGHRGTELLGLMEQVLVAERSAAEMFATCATVVLDAAGHRATVTLAGHDEPLLISPTEATRPVPARHGMALGMLPGSAAWHPTQCTVPPHATLLMHTDGLVEGHTDGDQRLGTDGLIRIIEEGRHLPPPALIDHLTGTARSLDGGRHTDDLAVLVLSWNG
ncbi:PP2C family protein-serine/threonine phosphatase [Streptomyces lydicus]|uniref:PP2C family protein-serine/threonine phosphatase n=1 Tax=Streptomyces lydicus TaxID=47763 RepID=UPI0037A64893